MFHPEDDHLFSLHGVKHPILAHAEPEKMYFFTFHAGDVDFWPGFKWIFTQELDVPKDSPLGLPLKF